MARKNGRPTYLVEKFVPTECPKCRRRFRVPNRDFIMLFGDIIRGKRVWRIVNWRYDIIVCSGCRNFTARVKIETRRVFNLTEAQSLVRDVGFTAIWRGRAFGRDAEVTDNTVHPLGLGLMLPFPTLAQLQGITKRKSQERRKT